MPTYAFTDHLLSGDHASRPAASAVPQGTLYACDDHPLIYKSDGVSVWSTWASLGAAAIEVGVAYDAASALVTPTPVGNTAVPDLAAPVVTTTVVCTFIITYSVSITKGSDGDKIRVSPDLDGSDIAPAVYSQSVGETAIQQLSFTWIKTGVAAGAHTITMEYAAALGTSSTTFGPQHLYVRAIPE